MDELVRKRLGWIKLYQQCQNAGKTCLKCGISRPTLRKWLTRFELFGEDGLTELSRKPLNSPGKKITAYHEGIILSLRNDRKLGHRRIASELKRLHSIHLSLASIHKVLEKHNKQYLSLKRIYRKKITRYNRPTPGDRVQVDVCKIAPGLYEYTAIDDCSRSKVIELYSRRTATNTLFFLEVMLEQMPFPIQRIQTDRGREFFSYKFQETLMEYGIKFRPIKPYSPYLNGKVDRTQRTDLDEFYSTVSLKDPKLKELLKDWQHYYNWYRAHSSLRDKTPVEVVVSLSPKTPYWDEVETSYDPLKERIRIQHYASDQRSEKLKRCL
ncbi:IS481 family transposase [Chitinophaga sp. 30R24]|uniref:IS481 family transposase n=1 Tax=Chitinophaga sp. 30R24 TaxID=3248838 RepID=UPI003B915C43